MNFWLIYESPREAFLGTGWDIWLDLIDPLPIDPKVYCQPADLYPKNGVKPASLLSMNGVLYFAVELHYYGDNPSFNHQRSIQAWIITSADHRKTWTRSATPPDFFTGRLASPHFIQFGRDYACARDELHYAVFPSADDGGS